MVSNGVSEDFRKQVDGFGLTTAHILYRRPDHQWLLQSTCGRPTTCSRNFPN